MALPIAYPSQGLQYLINGKKNALRSQDKRLI
jgi:hypothetical protein